MVNPLPRDAATAARLLFLLAALALTVGILAAVVEASEVESPFFEFFGGRWQTWFVVGSRAIRYYIAMAATFALTGMVLHMLSLQTAARNPEGRR